MESPAMAEPTISQEHISNSMTPFCEDHDDKYGVPTLVELGKKKKFTSVYKKQ